MSINNNNPQPLEVTEMCPEGEYITQIQVVNDGVHLVSISATGNHGTILPVHGIPWSTQHTLQNQSSAQGFTGFITTNDPIKTTLLQSLTLVYDGVAIGSAMGPVLNSTSKSRPIPSLQSKLPQQLVGYTVKWTSEEGLILLLPVFKTIVTALPVTNVEMKHSFSVTLWLLSAGVIVAIIIASWAHYSKECPVCPIVAPNKTAATPIPKPANTPKAKSTPSDRVLRSASASIPATTTAAAVTLLSSSSTPGATTTTKVV